MFAGSANAGASNATLRTTINTWSKHVGADAHLVALAAQSHQPNRMISRANLFHSDALHARIAATNEKPTTIKGRQARQLALVAFADYALAGNDWAASGRARVANKHATSITYATAGAKYARAGDDLLVNAGKLLR
jgi:hypothetical protein